jgi:hypothetical protein
MHSATKSGMKREYTQYFVIEPLMLEFYVKI